MKAITQPNDLLNAQQATLSEKYQTTAVISGGLTKREYFAAAAMQGLIARDTSQLGDIPEWFASTAVAHADALIEALNYMQD